MAKQASDKASSDQIRPKILVESVETARAVVAARYGEAMARNLGNGDVIDLAMKIIAEQMADGE